MFDSILCFYGIFEMRRIPCPIAQEPGYGNTYIYIFHVIKEELAHTIFVQSNLKSIYSSTILVELLFDWTRTYNGEANLLYQQIFGRTSFK